MFGRMLVFRTSFLIFGLVLLALGRGALAAAPELPAQPVEAGLLAHEFSLTLEPGVRSEYAGPFFYREKTEFAETWALPPFFSRWEEPGTGAVEWDFLYPLMGYDRFGNETRWRFFEVLSFSTAGSVNGEDVERFTIFPFYFQQRSPDPAKNYTAVVPFYGTFKNRLFRDEYKFFMTPLYLQSRKRDMVTDNYLFPFVHVRHGDGLTGWQFWPLYGEEHRAVGWRTNLLEEPDIVGGYEKHFVLWPIFMRQFTGIGTENPDRQVVLLPFYHLQRSPRRDTTTIIPPFFGWLDDRQNRYREYRFPYPFVVWSRGEGETGWRVWPLYGDFYRRGARVNYVLWPLYRGFHSYDTNFERDRARVLIFLYNDVRERNRGTGETRQSTYLWPLFAAERSLDGKQRFQMLALMEPVLPVSESIRRHWSQVWSIWRSEKDPKNQRSSESFLWNLYRAERTAETRKCSLLFGLIRYQSTPEGSRWQWFYLPTRKTSPAAPSAKKS